MISKTGSAEGIFLYSSEFLPFKGGVGRYTEDTAFLLADGNFAPVTVFTETANHGGYPDQRVPFRVVRRPIGLFARHPWLNLALNALSSAAVLLSLRRHPSGWVVVTGKRAIFNFLFFRPLIGRRKTAIIVHGSELSEIETPRGWRQRTLRRAFLSASAAATRIIISNKYALGRFEALPGFDRSKIALLYPIVNPDRVVLQALWVERYRKEHFAKPAFSIVTLARLSPRKGQDHTIQALGRLSREVTQEFRYFIIGNGSYKDELNKAIDREGLRGRVHILEGLSDDQAYALTSLCDLFVMPNREHKGTVEGFGISFLEANVLGLPALAGRSGGSVEAVEDGANGMLCDGDDPDDIYRKVREYQENADLRSRLKAQCRQVALDRFSFERWKGPYQAAFRDGRIA